MPEATMNRYALVTGANKGIGFGICEQILAANGTVVLLTARSEKRGLEAVEKLKKLGFADRVMFHQLDVADQESVDSLANFVKTQIGKLDILVNNAGVLGVKPADNTDGGNLKSAGFSKLLVEWEEVDWQEENVIVETCELAEECLGINYYGTKRMIKAFAPLLKLSDSPRIVNVSSILGLLKNIPSQWAKELLGDADKLSEERIDEVLSQYLQDIREGSAQTKGWPAFLPAYTLSKAAINAYTRVVARKNPSLCINAVAPGLVSTDMNYNTGVLSVEEGAKSIVRLALVPQGSGHASGCFFDREEQTPF